MIMIFPKNPMKGGIPAILIKVKINAIFFIRGRWWLFISEIISVFKNSREENKIKRFMEYSIK